MLYINYVTKFRRKAWSAFAVLLQRKSVVFPGDQLWYRCVTAGCQTYVQYPVTPCHFIFYTHDPSIRALCAHDVTTRKWRL